MAASGGGSFFAEHDYFARAAAADPVLWDLQTQQRQHRGVVRYDLQKPYSIDSSEAAVDFPIPNTFRCPGHQCASTFQLPAGSITDEKPWQQEWKRAERHWKTQCTYAQMRRERRNEQQRRLRQAKNRAQVR